MANPSVHAQRTERFDLNALHETSRLLSASLDLNFVLANLLLTSMSKLLVTRGAVLLFDALEGSYRAATIRGIRDLQNGQMIALPKIDTNEALQGDDVPEALAAHRIGLILPVRYAHREIGLIALGRKATGGPFETEELRFIQSLVNMTSAAVHNSLMVDELQLANNDLDRKVQQLKLLFDLSNEFNATVDRERVLKLLTFSLMGEMLTGKYLFLLRRSHHGDSHQAEETLQLVASKGLPDEDLGRDVIHQLGETRELILLDEDDAAAWHDLRERGIALVMPLLQHGKTCGVLGLGPKKSGDPYGLDDIEFLYALGNLALSSVQNSFLIEEQLEKERLEEEMRLARTIQERLFPQSIPKMAGTDVATLALPSRVVGGDYFDVMRLHGDRLLLAVADVTGKGIPAALLMANIQACLHILVPIDVNIEEATVHINRVICENTGADKFITFFLAIYKPADHSLQYVNAGHNPPFLLRTDGRLELLEKGGLLLGVMKNIPYERGETTLGVGDTLVLYTDGVTEAMNEGEEEYEEARLETALRAAMGTSAQSVVDGIYRDIQAFTGNADALSDDLTLVVLRVTE